VPGDVKGRRGSSSIEYQRGARKPAVNLGHSEPSGRHATAHDAKRCRKSGPSATVSWINAPQVSYFWFKRQAYIAFLVGSQQVRFILRMRPAEESTSTASIL